MELAEDRIQTACRQALLDAVRRRSLAITRYGKLMAAVGTYHEALKWRTYGHPAEAEAALLALVESLEAER